MSNRKKQIPPALRHGVYSGLGLLPGEDPAAFEKFRREIFAEYNINGRSEEAIADNLVHYMWRREHLSTYGLAEHAKKRHDRIYANLTPPIKDFAMQFEYEEETRSPEELDELRKQADKKAQIELGAAGLELADAQDIVTTDYLLKELSISERLDQMIVRGFKELLFVKGLKSISSPPASTVTTPRLRKVA